MPRRKRLERKHVKKYFERKRLERKPSQLALKSFLFKVFFTCFCSSRFRSALINQVSVQVYLRSKFSVQAWNAKKGSTIFDSKNFSGAQIGQKWHP